MKKKQIWKIFEDFWNKTVDAINEIPGSIDKKSFINCVEAISNCEGKIITSGAGTSAMAAKKISHTFSCIERPSFFLSPADAVHGALGSVQEKDILILISKGGNTREIINMIPAAIKKKTFILGVTENESSVLADKCDLLLKIKVSKEADDFNMLATTSTMAVISTFDAISVCVMYYTNYTKEQFGIIHPGGAVGERLLKK